MHGPPPCALSMGSTLPPCDLLAHGKAGGAVVPWQGNYSPISPSLPLGQGAPVGWNVPSSSEGEPDLSFHGDDHCGSLALGMACEEGSPLREFGTEVWKGGQGLGNP